MLKRYDLIAQAKKQRVIPDLVYQKKLDVWRSVIC